MYQLLASGRPRTTAVRPRSAPALLTIAASVALLASGPPPIGPAPSAAHTSISSQRPAPGRTARTNITVAAVVFSTTVRSAQIRVTGPGGRTVSGTTTRDAKNPKRYSTRLAKRLKPGKYRTQLTYSATDGHRQVVAWTFTLTK